MLGVGDGGGGAGGRDGGVEGYLTETLVVDVLLFKAIARSHKKDPTTVRKIKHEVRRQVRRLLFVSLILMCCTGVGGGTF